MENKRKRWLGVGMLALLLALAFSLGFAAGVAHERSQRHEKQMAHVSVQLDQITHALMISAHTNRGN